MNSLPTGKLVVAHPTRVAQADQIAAAEQNAAVMLRENVSPTHVYIFDLDKLTEYPEEGFFRWRDPRGDAA